MLSYYTFGSLLSCQKLDAQKMEHIQRIEAQLTRNNYAAVLVAIMAVLIATCRSSVFCYSVLTR